MLDLSKDNQLYFKAFNDYTDLDGDGVIETTYKHGIDYYGYFDSYKCYDYNGGLGRYVPMTYKPKDKSKPDGDPANLAAKYCSGNWSGNFLNWVAMSRMDEVRKLLYGGFRSTDATSGAGGLTVLERAYLPTDAHSWAEVLQRQRYLAAHALHRHQRSFDLQQHFIARGHAAQLQGRHHQVGERRHGDHVVAPQLQRRPVRLDPGRGERQQLQRCVQDRNHAHREHVHL